MKVFAHLLGWSCGLAPPQTQTTDAERLCLARHARGVQRVVELGVWHGVTTSVLRRSMASDGVLWAVDPFEPGRLGFSAQRLIATREVARQQNGSVRWLRMTGVAAAAAYQAEGEPPPDLVFIDADHTYEAVTADWRAWSSLIAPGGIVCLHDSRSSAARNIDGAGSVAATRDVVLTDARFELCEYVDTLTAVRRRGT